jgi:hypothetical protein
MVFPLDDRVSERSEEVKVWFVAIVVVMMSLRHHCPAEDSFQARTDREKASQRSMFFLFVAKSTRQKKPFFSLRLRES